MNERESDTSALEKSSFSDEATLRVILEDLDDLLWIPFCEQKRLLFWRRLGSGLQRARST